MKREQLFLLIFATGIIVNAQSSKEILKKIQSKFSTINTFTSNYTQVFYTAQGKVSSKETGKFFYKKKNKFIVEQKRSSIISDAETVWNYDKIRKKVVISNFYDDPTSFSIERFIFDYPSQCKIIFNKQDSNDEELSISLVAKDEQLDLKEIKLWVNKNYLITKFEIVDLMDMKYGFEFSNIIENVEIQDARFKFYPPKGTQIIDLR